MMIKVIGGIAVLALTISLYTLFSGAEFSAEGEAKYGYVATSNLAQISSLINAQCLQGVKNCGYITNYALKSFSNQIKNDYVEISRLENAQMMHNGKYPTKFENTCDKKCSVNGKLCLFAYQKATPHSCNYNLEKVGGTYCLCY